MLVVVVCASLVLVCIVASWSVVCNWLLKWEVCWVPLTTPNGDVPNGGVGVDSSIM